MNIFHQFLLTFLRSSTCITDDDPLFIFLASPGEIQSDIPTSDEKSLHSPFSDQWKRAQEEELDACNLNVVWGPPISLPPGKQVVNPVVLCMH